MIIEAQNSDEEYKRDSVQEKLHDLWDLVSTIWDNYYFEIRQKRQDVEELLWELRDYSFLSNEKEVLGELYRQWAISPYGEIRRGNMVRWEEDGGYTCVDNLAPGYSLVIERFAQTRGIDVKASKREGEHCVHLSLEGNNIEELENILDSTCSRCGSPKDIIEGAFHDIGDDRLSYNDELCPCHSYDVWMSDFFPRAIEYIKNARLGKYGNRLTLLSFLKVRLINCKDEVSYHFLGDCLNIKIVYGVVPKDDEFLYAGIRTPFTDKSTGSDIYEYDYCNALEWSKGEDVSPMFHTPVDIVASQLDDSFHNVWMYHYGFAPVDPSNIYVVTACDTIEKVTHKDSYIWGIAFDKDQWVKDICVKLI